jgi:hypothetical protein
MKIVLSDAACVEVSSLGQQGTVAFADVLRDLKHVKNDRVFSFSCSFEGRKQRVCELRLSEHVARIGSHVFYAYMGDHVLVLGLPPSEQAKTYRFESIADDLKILSATNLYEHAFKYDASSLPSESLAEVLNLYVETGLTPQRWRNLRTTEMSAGEKSYRWLPRSRYGKSSFLRDMFLDRERQFLFRLIDENLRAPEPRLVDDPALVERYKRLGDRIKRLADDIVASAKRWMSTVARENFKEIMDAAVTQPQVLERGDEEIVIISKRLLSTYANPKSAAEIVESFRRDPVKARPLDMQRSEGPDLDEFDLPALH